MEKLFLIDEAGNEYEGCVDSTMPLDEMTLLMEDLERRIIEAKGVKNFKLAGQLRESWKKIEDYKYGRIK